MEVVAREFQLRARLKGKVLAYGLEKGFYLFRFFGGQGEGQGSQSNMGGGWVGGGSGALATKFPIIEGAHFLGACPYLIAVLVDGVWGQAALSNSSA